jgi:Rod binding domain-containing protein
MTDPISSAREIPGPAVNGQVRVAFGAPTMEDRRPRPASGVSVSSDPDATLRHAAGQLEGVFVQHLFAAMRETVPAGGLVDGGSGEDIFNSMLDSHLADQLAENWDRGLGAAVYRQLRATITNPETSADPPIQSVIAE